MITFRDIIVQRSIQWEHGMDKKFKFTHKHSSQPTMNSDESEAMKIWMFLDLMNEILRWMLRYPSPRKNLHESPLCQSLPKHHQAPSQNTKSTCLGVFEPAFEPTTF